MSILPIEAEYVLNHVSRLFSRKNEEDLHNFGQYETENQRGRYCEPWRLPVVDGYFDPDDRAGSYRLNRVTFVLKYGEARHVGLLGSFAELHRLIPLARVEDTELHAVTVLVPKGQVHRYKFCVDGKYLPDPINPQTSTLATGQLWSRFFTHGCRQPISFERWELALLERLTAHILPFRTPEAEDLHKRMGHFEGTYRLDQSVGAANYIDKLVATGEAHYLDTYRTGLRQIDRILRTRYPGKAPFYLEKNAFEKIYDELGSGRVDGWDYAAYQEPQHFLKILRRHTLTGAFSHPKYGGNIGGAGWAYLEEIFRGPDGRTLFDWRNATEWPLGNDMEYLG